MKTVKLTCLLIFISLITDAQLPTFKWAYTSPAIGSAYADKNVVDSSGNVIVIGSYSATVDFDPGPGTEVHTANGHSDFFVLKVSGLGNFMWVKTFGGISFHDYSHAISYDHNGDFILTGNFVDTVDFDPGPGTHKVGSQGYSDIFVLKLDRDGNLVWVKTMGGNTDDSGQAVTVDSGNNIYLTGFITGTVDLDPSANTAMHSASASSYDIFFLKLSSSGNYVWSKSIGYDGIDFGGAITVDNNNDIIAAGAFAEAFDFDSGTGTRIMDADSGSIFLMKMSGSTGNFIWSKNFGNLGDASVEDLKADASGDIFIAGNYLGLADFAPGNGLDTSNASTTWAGYFCKYSSQGTYLWKSILNSTATVMLADIDLDNAGDVYLAGKSNGSITFAPGTSSQLITQSFLSDYVAKFSNAGSLIDAAIFSTLTNTINGYIIRYGGVSVDKNTGDVFTSGFYYRDVDFDPGPGTYTAGYISEDFYVHKMSAFKGFNAVKIEELQTGQLVRKAYPIPVQGVITFEGTENGFSIVIVDQLGKEVIRQESSEGVTNMYIGSLGSGIYFARIMQPEGLTVIKLVKE